MPHARKTDPTTSHEAAASVENVTATQDAILKVLEVAQFADHQLIKYYTLQARYGRFPKASESGIRSRRAELVKRGLVVDTGERETLPSGRKAIVWTAA